jgi:hypothetical protein
MAKQIGNVKIGGVNKKSSQGGRNSQIKLSSMNKANKRSYKRYRGQGR